MTKSRIDDCGPFVLLGFILLVVCIFCVRCAYVDRTDDLRLGAYTIVQKDKESGYRGITHHYFVVKKDGRSITVDSDRDNWVNYTVGDKIIVFERKYSYNGEHIEYFVKD